MIHGTVIGADAVIANLGQVHTGVHRAVVRAVRRKTNELVRLQKEKVSGPVLKTKTGTTRRGINAEFAETDTSITGSAGIGKEKAKYPAVHEYGGTFNIKEHVRTVKKIFGKPLKTPVTQTVRAHTATFPERSFLRSALREMREEILREIETAAAEAVRRGGKG